MHSPPFTISRTDRGRLCDHFVLVLEPDEQAKKFLHAVTGIVGIAILIYVSSRLVQDWRQINTLEGLQQLALPGWLTVDAFPHVYALTFGWGTSCSSSGLALRQTTARRSAVQS